jgi:hypothetical protein
MPQLIIDPDEVGKPAATTSISLIPERTRNFGFVPDLSLCQPGDLILSFSRSRDKIGQWIVHAQNQAGFAAEHSRWTHAAVFLYEDFIVEADPGAGVRNRSLYEDIPDSVLRVRRHPNLSDVERYKIALCALRMQGLRYSKAATLMAGWRALSGLWNRGGYPQTHQAVFCSKVFYDAFVEITRSLLNNCPVNEPVFPAHLSATNDLEDVRIPWLRLSGA